MECSICIATHNKSEWLDRTLESIVFQRPPFDFEIIVINDNSTDDTAEICDCYSDCIKYKQLIHNKPYRNPAIARNTAYKMARGRVLICQSDEVVHISQDTIEKLVVGLKPNTFTIATVFNTDIEGNIINRPLPILSGPQCQRPLFFLGAVLRSDVYKVGGNDELYTNPAFEDDAFADSLIRGLGLNARYDADVIGHHIDHPRPANLRKLVNPSQMRYKKRQKLCNSGQESWLSPGAPWIYRD